MSANHSFAILERPRHNSLREVFPNAANCRVVTSERVWEHSVSSVQRGCLSHGTDSHYKLLILRLRRFCALGSRVTGMHFIGTTKHAPRAVKTPNTIQILPVLCKN